MALAESDIDLLDRYIAALENHQRIAAALDASAKRGRKPAPRAVAAEEAAYRELLDARQVCLRRLFAPATS